MDIATHAAFGLAVSAPMIAEHPVAAVMFTLGSVFPDLDGLGRVTGKKGFFRLHRTYTHSFFGVVVFSLLAGLILAFLKIATLLAVAAFAAGILLHMLLDWTNSYGLAIWTPFSPTRTCKHWIYFVDVPFSFVSALAVIAPAIILFTCPERFSFFPWIAGVYLLFAVTYIAVRRAMHARAVALSPDGTTHVIADAIVPWWFCGVAEADGGKAHLFHLSLFSSKVVSEAIIDTHDAEYQALMEQLEEFRLMREVLPAYHVVDVRHEGELLHLECRELAIRRYWGNFGQLEVTYDLTRRQFTKKVFHV